MSLRKLLGFAVLLMGVSMFYNACSLKPQSWKAPQSPELVGVLELNNKLEKTSWIDLKGWWGPEDVEIDSLGNIYAGVHTSKNDFSDGAIIKINPKGQLTVFCNSESWITGMEMDQHGNLIACDSKRGLIKIDAQGSITVLASKDEHNNELLIPNDIDIASDGMIYFSNTSSRMRFSQKVARKLIFELQPDGGLYRYDPNSNKVTTLIDSSFFGNGVALSQDDSFVLMADLSKYRVMRYWLKGEKKGETEVFMDNLPGFPNGISRRENGNFWLGFSTKRIQAVDYMHDKPFLKRLVYATPQWMQPKQEAFGIVMEISERGKILRTLYDPSGQFVSEASSIEEYNGSIYIGGDLTDHIGKFELE